MKEELNVVSKIRRYPEQLCATEEISELACPNLYLNREINWLDFDAKVLDGHGCRSSAP